MKWQDVPGWFDQANYDMFKTIKLPKNPLIVEIGTHLGKSAHALRELWPDAEIISCDPNDKPDKIIDGYTYIKCRGQELKIDRKIDLLFIDSLHTYQDTKQLFEKFKDQADVIVFHDYHKELCSGADGVKQFVDELGNCELFETGEFGGAIFRKENLD